ncbi:cell division control protein 14, SIN component-domain-containing protein [Ganoderma leucocontextum]|nr:cell division control protein 14, SIN component-domain-containing protein [Ganoderma leucocontextum]
MDPAVEGPYPNTAPMHDILQDALDDLVSTRTSTATKGDALVAIEHVLAETADPRAVGLPGYFNALQDTFQCNVSSRIISWTSVASALLDKALTRGSTDNVTQCEVMVLSSQLAQGMGIIQGVALVHKPSKQCLGRRYSLEVLLDLLLVSRHLTPPTTSSTPTSPKADPPSTSPPKSCDLPLASVILDTLLCILVDSSPSLRNFEDLNGVQVVVKILKRAGTPREVRMKCLEFLYFYLLDEAAPPESAIDAAVSNLAIPDTPPTRPTHRSTSSLSVTSRSGFTTTPSSRSSSGSSAFSVLSTSTTGTSASLHETPVPPKSQASNETPGKPPFTPKSVMPGLAPSTGNVTPPSSRPAADASALGRGQPRSKLLILKKEVEYVPLSPKKPQLSHLSRGPSGLRPKHPDHRRSISQLRSPGSPADTGDSRQGSVGTPRTRLSTPLTSHSRGLSVSSISSISSVESASLRTPPPNPGPGAGPRRDRLKGSHTEILETPQRASSKVKGQVHRRAQSLADFSSSSPSAAPLLVAESPLAASRSASAPTGSGAGGRAGANRGAKTMAEKKEILGTMLGNVDALVEGVKKAGVWGLS